MKTILNKSARPIQVPLPRGKKIHLGPHRTGEIANNAIEHPPLIKLIEAGDLEIMGDGNSQADPRKAAVGTASTPANRPHGASSSHRSGDR